MFPLKNSARKGLMRNKTINKSNNIQVAIKDYEINKSLIILS